MFSASRHWLTNWLVRWTQTQEEHFPYDRWMVTSIISLRIFAIIPLTDQTDAPIIGGFEKVFRQLKQKGYANIQCY